MRPAVVRIVGNSSRYDRSPRSLIRAVRRYALRANLIATTEVARNERSSILARLLGWGLIHFESGASGEDECAIQYRKRYWRVVSAHPDMLSARGIARRSGALCYSVDALFRNRRTGQRVMICAFHLPTRGDGQLTVWLDCIDRLMGKVDGWTRDPDIDAVILVGDWNANWRSDSIRKQMRQAFPGAEFTWDGRLPSGGTHDRALIDYAAVYGGTITDAELLADDASSDHRAWRMRVRLEAVA